MKKRRRYSAQQKVEILRRHLLEHVPVSDLCDQYGIDPSMFYRWQKALFENAAAALETKGDAEKRKLNQMVTTLEAKISKKDEVIAEIMQSHVQLKKELGET